MRLLRISMVGFLFVVAVSAQQKPSPKSAAKPGIVSGRVFAITKSGDLKPARLANVYLIYLARSVKVSEVSVGTAWTDNLTLALDANLKAAQEHNAALAELNKERQANHDVAERESFRDPHFDLGPAMLAEADIDAKIARENAGWSDSAQCRKGLMAYQNALVGMSKWASSENRQWQILAADTDEDGIFKIAATRPGEYFLLVHGQAGFNDAFWVSDNFTVNLGAETALKLSQPKEACLGDV